MTAPPAPSRPAPATAKASRRQDFGFPGIRPFLSEWKKLLRRGQVLGTWGVMVGFVLLLGILVFANATPNPAPVTDATQRAPPQVPFTRLEVPHGWVLPFTATANLMGIVALVTAASNLATEYTTGTLKMLLVREPRRTLLLGGKALAVWSFTVVGVTLALLVSVGVSTVMAGVKGIDSSSWFSGDGWLELLKAWGNTMLTTLIWGLMGTMLAIILRSGPPAIGIGIAYPILVEGLLGLAIPKDILQFMPGQVLGVVANGGGPGAFASAASTATTVALGYLAALGMLAVYGTVFTVVSFVLIHRRDVN
jgi:ABC-type transport system involved in multi-copper enzyme maturation permease subunit